MAHMVRKLRTEQGWSQEQLAEIAGLSPRTVQRAETGKNCSLDTAQALAAAFDTTPSVFLSGDADEARGNLEDDQRHRRITREVRRRMGFFRHLGIYLAVNALLFAINAFNGFQTVWFIYPLLGWGIGIASHAFKVFVLFGQSWEEREVERRKRAEE